MKSKPFSIRLSTTLDAALSREAERLRKGKGALLEELADEALRCRRFPGIAFRDTPPWRRAWVIGTGLDVWEIVQALQDFGSVKRMAAEGEIEERHIRLAQAYYAAYEEEIDAAIEENRRSVQELAALHPTIDVRLGA
jgi:uncharacterized protein (DUF433 family)